MKAISLAIQFLPEGLPSGVSEFGIPDPEGALAPDGRRYHAGKDIFLPAGWPLRAPAGGRIVEVRASRGSTGQVFGGVVKLEGYGGRVYVLRHVVPARGVRVGIRVRAGRLIARVAYWRDGGEHVHLEVWKTLRGGYFVRNMLDPITVLRRVTTTCIRLPGQRACFASYRSEGW